MFYCMVKSLLARGVFMIIVFEDCTIAGRIGVICDKSTLIQLIQNIGVVLTTCLCSGIDSGKIIIDGNCFGQRTRLLPSH